VAPGRAALRPGLEARGPDPTRLIVGSQHAAHWCEMLRSLDSRTPVDERGSLAPAPAAAEPRAFAADGRVRTLRHSIIGSLIVLGFGAITVAGWSLAYGGIGWDAWSDTAAALQVRAIPESDTLSQAYKAVWLNNEFYGVFIQQSADLLHRVFTGSTHDLQPKDSATYLYQGGITLALSVVSVTALAVAVGLVFRSALAAAFTWSLTLSTPLWLGLSHLDFKDVPVAAGLNLITAGLVLSIVIPQYRKATLLAFLLEGLGAMVVLATRPGSLLLLGAFLAASCGAFGAWGWFHGRPRIPAAIASPAALVIALVFVWATNPIARIDLLQWLRDTSKFAQAAPYGGIIRVAGGDVQPAHLPWWYVPAWLGAQLPVLTIAVLIVGLIMVGAVALARRGEWTGSRMIALVPLSLQGIVIPLAILLSGARIYDGIRHLLFALPALIALAGGGLALVEHRSPRGSRWRTAIPLAATVIVAASLFDSARWAPYAYAYINPIAGHNTHSQSWDLDYWGASAREGVARMHKAGPTSVSVQPAVQVGLPFGAAWYTGTFGPKSGIYVFSRWNFTAKTFGCTVLFKIKRDGHELGEGAECPPHTTTAGWQSG